MIKYLLTSLFAISVLTRTAKAQDVICLAIEQSLGIQGAQAYASDIMTIIELTVNYATDTEVELEPQEKAQAYIGEWVLGKDNIIWDDAFLIRDAYYKLLKKKNVSYLAQLKGIKVQDFLYTPEKSPIKGAEYLISYEISEIDENTEKESIYEITFGISYIYDTCSGENYTPGETGVKVITNKDRRVLAIFRKIK